jgi:hypothetical protein
VTRPKRNKRHLYPFRLVLILVVPLLVASWSIALRQSSGPFWLGNNSDPSYSYLMNALALSQVQPTVHADHPGATLHWLGAALLYPIEFLTGEGDLVDDVLKRPEVFLTGLHRGLIALLLATLVVCGLLICKWTGDPVTAVLFQLGTLTSGNCRASLSEVSPEPLLLILAIWLAVLVFYQVTNIGKDYRAEPAWQYGLVVGLGLALKVNYAPLALLPLFMLSTFRRWMVYIGTLLLTFLLLVANPLANSRGFLGFLVNNLLVREGYNRPLEEGRSIFGAMVDGLGFLASEIGTTELPVILLTFGFTILGFTVLLLKRSALPAFRKDPYTRTWLGILVVLATQILLVANGPVGKTHYLVPAFGLTGLLAAFSWWWLMGSFRESDLPVLYGRCLAGLGFLLLSGMTAFAMPGQLRRADLEARAWSEAHIFREESGLLNEPTLFYYRASSREFALHFGNLWAGNLFSAQLQKLYPDFLYFDIWNQRFEIGFGSPVEALGAIQEDPIYIQGMKGDHLKSLFAERDRGSVVIESLFDGAKEQVLEIRTNPDPMPR